MDYLLCVVLERNETIIFIFSLFQPFPAYFGLKRNHKRFFNFLKFFPIFLEYSITRWVRTKWNDNFYFLYFSAFSNLFWHKMKPQLYFLIFFIFLLFFWNFLLPVGLERNETIIFIFSLFQPFPSCFGLK